MNSKQRMIAAINRKVPDRLPVTTHHLMSYFLDKYMEGISQQDFFDEFALDPILWTNHHRPDVTKNEYYDPNQNRKELSGLELI